MEGKSVRALQELLIAIGYLTTDADGIFGAFTRNAVMGFQADRMLDADGEVGGATWAELINNYGG
jgi:peptidoglycan hydrolase-like protein with peptidoglycan-binding domain